MCCKGKGSYWTFLPLWFEWRFGVVVVLGADGDAGAAVENRVQVGWNGFRKLVPLLAGGDISLRVGGSCAVVACGVMCCMEVGPGP